MNQDLLASVEEVKRMMVAGNILLVDCRFLLDKPQAGYEAYLAGHIPGAVYANLDVDLSSPVTQTSGRHPLPGEDEFAAFLARIGWLPGRRMVVYDDMGGAIAGRLWWLMKYFGYGSAAMLDGGINAWIAAGYELETGVVEIEPVPVLACKPRDELVLTSDDVASGLEEGSIVLIDARAQERFRGEVEPIDRIAGHIPGSVNYPFNLNLDAGGLFKTAGELYDGLSAVSNEDSLKDTVHMCGSGVTACHNLVAAELAGLGEQRLYVGSWSEWIRDSSRPVSR